MKILAKKMRICKDIEEAFQFNDEPKLRQRIAELEGLIKEIEVRDQPLEPPKTQFDMLVQECHQLGVLASGLLENFDLFEWQENIETQRKFGEEAYQSKDQQRYNECYTNLVSHFQHLRDKLQDKIRGSRGEPTDEERAQGLVAGLQQAIEELEFLARAQNKQNILQDLERHAKALEKLEPFVYLLL